MRRHRIRQWASAIVIVTAAIIVFATGLARAEPIKLTLSFFTSDRSTAYQCQVKPFVDAVNAEGTLDIDVRFSGGISPSLPEQPKVVLSGLADIALIVAGTTPEEFPDSFVLALPGLFRSEKEASRVFTRLVGANALQGYDRFFVIGADVSSAEFIHSRNPVEALADLRGQHLRVNNETTADVLKRLGAIPVSLPLNRSMDALSQGTIDGVALDPSVVEEFGISRLAHHHYLLPLGGAPLALLMNREKFAALPPPAQAVVRKYSGDWLVEQKSVCADGKVREALAHWRATPSRRVVEPSTADMAAAHGVFDAAIRDWTAASPHNRALMDQVIAVRDALRKETAR